jgi:hypothetical protein
MEMIGRPSLRHAFIIAALLVAALSLRAGDASLIWSCLGADPQHEATVQWLATEKPAEAVLEVGASGASPVRQAAKFAPGSLGGWLATVELKGLAPGTEYVYRMAGNGAAAQGRFATAPAESADFTFAVVGDVQGKGASGLWQQAATWLAKRKPAFWIPVGDLVDLGHEGTQWHHFFADGAPLFQCSPVMPVIGNHDPYADESNHGQRRTVSRYPQPFFEFFPPSCDRRSGPVEGAYAFVYGEAQFAILNAYPTPAVNHPLANAPRDYERQRRDEQTAWLAKVFAASSAPWKFVFLHPPIYSSGPHGVSGDGPYERTLARLCDQSGVSAVFAGHTHAFEVTKPLRDGKVAGQNQAGTVYYNAAGINYSAIAQGSWFTDARQKQERLPLVALVHVTGKTVTVETWNWQENRLAQRVTLDR